MITKMMASAAAVAALASANWAVQSHAGLFKSISPRNRTTPTLWPDRLGRDWQLDVRRLRRRSSQGSLTDFSAAKSDNDVTLTILITWPFPSSSGLDLPTGMTGNNPNPT